MQKSNTKSEKIFSNNNENIKTIEKLPQIKMSDLSITLDLHYWSKVIIDQQSNIKNLKCTVANHWKRMIKWHHRPYVFISWEHL